MKPLTYQCLQMVLQEMSFMKRKELYAKCPAIRKQEERIGYRVNEMSVSQTSTHCWIDVDNIETEINDCPEDKTKKCGVIMTNGKTGATVKQSIDVDPVEAAEKWITYILNRLNTRIQLFYLIQSPICLLKCDHPITIINLTMYVRSEVPEDSGRSSWLQTTVPVRHLTTDRVFRDDTMKTARSVKIIQDDNIDGKILSEWQAIKISTDQPIPLEQIVIYCTGIAESGRPIGFRCESYIKFLNMEHSTLDWLAKKANARKTSWNGRKCFTISLNNASELNVHGNLDNRSNCLIIEVNEKGTAIDRR
uniref:FBA_2 domain-containing protein n=1 Tax=Caenorhabditis tropicalis TaxID=1561998 RepID=A0A1I7V119_9PELO